MEPGCTGQSSTSEGEIMTHSNSVLLQSWQKSTVTSQQLCNLHGILLWAVNDEWSMGTLGFGSVEEVLTEIAHLWVLLILRRATNSLWILDPSTSTLINWKAEARKTWNFKVWLYLENPSLQTLEPKPKLHFEHQMSWVQYLVGYWCMNLKAGIIWVHANFAVHAKSRWFGLGRVAGVVEEHNGYMVFF